MEVSAIVPAASGPVEKGAVKSPQGDTTGLFALLLAAFLGEQVQVLLPISQQEGGRGPEEEQVQISLAVSQQQGRPGEEQPHIEGVGRVEKNPILAPAPPGPLAEVSREDIAHPVVMSKQVVQVKGECQSLLQEKETTLFSAEQQEQDLPIPTELRPRLQNGPKAPLSHDVPSIPEQQEQDLPIPTELRARLRNGPKASLSHDVPGIPRRVLRQGEETGGDLLGVGLTAGRSTETRRPDTLLEPRAADLYLTSPPQEGASVTGEMDSLPAAQQMLPVTGSDLVEELVAGARLARREGETHLEIQLKPEVLGKLKVEFRYREGRLSTYFLVENLQVREILAAQLPLLREVLSQQGVQQEILAVDVFGDYQGSGESLGQGGQSSSYHQAFPEQKGLTTAGRENGSSGLVEPVLTEGIDYLV